MLLNFVHWIVQDILRFDLASRIGETVAFFIYDVIKINALLVALIFVLGIVRSFIPQDRMKRWLTLPGGLGYFVAALFGAVTPFCSCSSIPIFMTLLKAGVPLGVTFAFLVTSPVINEYLVVLMLGFFGWKITLAYVVSGILIGVVSGAVIGRFRMERFLTDDFNVEAVPGEPARSFPNMMSRVSYGWGEAVTIFKQVWLWVIVGVGVGAFIHNYVPQETVDALVRSTGIFSVPLAVLIGVPLYGSCAAIVPVAVVFFQKGVPLGTALAFMMAISALSLPEAILLRRVMKLPLILVFFCVTTLAIIITGYLFNALQPFLTI